MSSNKIPKVIHYCWFGNTPKSAFTEKCMNSWKKKLPDYKWKEWNEKIFDVNSVPFVRDAYKAKKWAFVSDYVRLHALYYEGGIYMDTDVKVMKTFDEFLQYNFFSSHEIQPHFYSEHQLQKLNSQKVPIDTNSFIYGWSVLSAVMGATKGLPYLKECMEYYKQKPFYNTEGKIDLDELIIGKHITRLILKYGYRYEDCDQLLDDNMFIAKSDVFVGNAIYLKPDSYAIHLCNGSWLDDNKDWKWKLRNNYPLLSDILSPFFKAQNKIKRLLK